MIKLNLSNTTSFKAHRSGWGYCMSKLKHLHSKNGLYLDDFMDRSFGWNVHNLYNGDRNDFKEMNPPYKKEWVGFLHNPPKIESWFDASNRPDALFEREIFLESLNFCKCIISLSEYHARWVRSKLEVPVISLKHPTEIPFKKWNINSFLKQERKKVVQIGYWLRKMDSIHKLKCDSRIEKIWLPSNENIALYNFEQYTKTRVNRKQERYIESSVKIKRISNQEFDDVLSSCVVFLDLDDASANNAIVESVARNTPIIINRHPAVEEYLGKEYPLYFTDLNCASSLLYDYDRIYEAHKYFKSMDKTWISGSYFANDLVSKLNGVI